MRRLAVDVSNNQRVIDWPAVAAATIDGAKIDVVFIKATEGTDFIDPYFIANWTAAGALGLRRIAYHFSRPYENTGAAEAIYFMERFNQVELGTDDSYALDQEDDAQPSADLRAHDVDFLRTVAGAQNFYGYYYSRVEFMQRHNLIGSFDLARHKLWLAAYQDVAPAIPRPWDHLSAWQFGQGACPGIAGPVDFDYVDD